MAELDKLVQGGPFPQLRQTLELSEFHPTLQGNSVDIWLNPSQEHYARWKRFRQALAQRDAQQPMPDTLVAERNELWAELWGCTVAEAEALLDMPGAEALVTWLIDRTWHMITHYANQRAK